MKKIFLKSYEDLSYLGGEFNIGGRDFEILCSTHSWDEAIEILKKYINGDFKFYSTYEAMRDAEGKIDTMICGLS